MSEIIEMEPSKIDPRGSGWSLDVATVEARTAPYPDEMAEATRWMAGFCRRRCGGELATLSGWVTKLRFNTSPETLSKVIRGQWNRNASGAKVENPIIKQTIFLDIVRELQREDKLLDRETGIPHIDTKTFTRIQNYIELRGRPQRICRFGFIAGPTGCQKTHSFKEICGRHNHQNFYHLEIPEKANMGEILQELCVECGKPYGGSMSKRKHELRTFLKADTTLIVDNIQRVYKYKDGQDQRAFNYFQKLQDDTGMTLILSTTYDFMRDFTEGMNKGYFEQFVGRCGGANKFLVLPPFASDKEVLQFAEAFALRDAKEHLPYLVAVSRLPGRIRTLLQNLQDAADLAKLEEKELTIEHVQSQLLNSKGQPLGLQELHDRRVEDVNAPNVSK